MIYKILKSFKGSQDGRFSEDFIAGTEADISDYLAGCAPNGSLEIADGSDIAEESAEPRQQIRSKRKEQ